MTELLSLFPPLAVAAPLAGSLFIGGRDLLGGERSERLTTVVIGGGLVITALANVAILTVNPGFSEVVDLDYGPWLAVGTYEIPVVMRVDALAMAFATLAIALTWMIARFSRTYLHREPGFLRFFVLLSMFCAGTQLVAYAGALDLMFAGWELMGFSSALFIGFFHERAEPTRSAIRAFATYRLCDAGFLLATVMTHELTGSTRLADLEHSAHMSVTQDSLVAALFLLSAMGKSALLPFSGWLPRAMEGPTPTSALFYGSVSIQAGLFLVMRVWSLVDEAPAVKAVAVGIGLATAAYGTLVARVHTDAKGTLAHATLAQTGLILAEFALGFTTLATWHMFGHALLRVWQYLRAPNTIADAHRLGHHVQPPTWLERTAPRAAAWLHAAALHRLRLDEWMDTLLAPVWWLAERIDQGDRRLRAAVDVDRRPEDR
jgi:NADH-quinone oxidoreductase subunit L